MYQVQLLELPYTLHMRIICNIETLSYGMSFSMYDDISQRVFKCDHVAN